MDQWRRTGRSSPSSSGKSEGPVADGGRVHRGDLRELGELLAGEVVLRAEEDCVEMAADERVQQVHRPLRGDLAAGPVARPRSDAGIRSKSASSRWVMSLTQSRCTSAGATRELYRSDVQLGVPAGSPDGRRDRHGGFSARTVLGRTRLQQRLVPGRDVHFGRSARHRPARLPLAAAGRPFRTGRGHGAGFGRARRD